MAHSYYLALLSADLLTTRLNGVSGRMIVFQLKIRMRPEVIWQPVA